MNCVHYSLILIEETASSQPNNDFMRRVLVLRFCDEIDLRCFVLFVMVSQMGTDSNNFTWKNR